MPGHPRRNRYEERTRSDFNSTRELVHHLLVTELGAVLVPESDKTVPQKWAAPRLTEKEMKDMGLFDDLAEDGIDLGEVDLNPYNYADGVYCMALVRAEFQERKNADWGDQIEVRYVFISMADGSETKYKGKQYSEWLTIPRKQDLKSDDEDKKNKAWNALNRTFQRMYQLGVQDPKSADVSDINEFRGNQYTIQLNTPKDNNPKERQYIQGTVKSRVADNDSPFDQE